MAPVRSSDTMSGVFRVLVGGALLALIGSLIAGLVQPVRHYQGDYVPQVAAIEFEDLANTPASSGAAILNRNPFSPARSIYSRAQASLPSAPQDIRLIGISRIDGRLRASLLIDGREKTAVEGDTLEAGEVRSLTTTAIEIAGPQLLRIELFQ